MKFVQYTNRQQIAKQWFEGSTQRYAEASHTVYIQQLPGMFYVSTRYLDTSPCNQPGACTVDPKGGLRPLPAVIYRSWV